MNLRPVRLGIGVHRAALCALQAPLDIPELRALRRAMRGQLDEGQLAPVEAQWRQSPGVHAVDPVPSIVGHVGKGGIVDAVGKLAHDG